jgi:hypothetical protein
MNLRNKTMDNVKNIAIVQDVSKRALQWYFKCYCVTPWTTDSLYAFKCKRFRNSINLRGRMMWEASMGSPPHVTNRYRGNAYANRYASNSPTVCVVLEHTFIHFYLGTWAAHFNCGVTWYMTHLVRKIKGLITPDRHNSGTPGAISTKLGTHTTICMYKNLMYIYIYIYIYAFVW